MNIIDLAGCYLGIGVAFYALILVCIRPDRKHWLPLFVIVTLLWPLLGFSRPR